MNVRWVQRVLNIYNPVLVHNPSKDARQLQ